MEGKEYNDWKNFGTRVKNSRNSIGMSVEKLAEKSNRTDNFISKTEIQSTSAADCDGGAVLFTMIFLKQRAFTVRFITR